MLLDFKHRFYIHFLSQDIQIISIESWNILCYHWPLSVKHRLFNLVEWSFQNDLKWSKHVFPLVLLLSKSYASFSELKITYNTYLFHSILFREKSIGPATIQFPHLGLRSKASNCRPMFLLHNLYVPITLRPLISWDKQEVPTIQIVSLWVPISIQPFRSFFGSGTFRF